MISPFILLAAGFPQVPASHAFSPADAYPVTVTADNVDLDGAGQLAFEPELAGFDVDPPAGGDGASLTVRLWLDAAGKPISCDMGQTILPQASQVACSQLMTSAHFSISPGMTMPLQRGFIDVAFSFFKDAPGAPIGRQVYAMPYAGYVNTTITYIPDATPDDQLLQHVRRQNIWRNSRRKLAECGPRQGCDVKRRACGEASADVRWSSV